MLTSATCLLYVPGDRPERFAKALGSGADGVIIDLEDSVHPSRKQFARESLGSFLAEAEHQTVYVRVNAGELVEDVAALVRPVAAVVLAEATLEGLHQFEQQWNSSHRPAPSVVALIESARALSQLNDISRHPWVKRLGVGEVDLAAYLALDPSEDRRELWPYRASLVLASRVHGLLPPVGPTELQWNDHDALRSSTRQLQRQGFGGRTAVHPAQVSIIQEVFAPTAEQVEAATRLLAEFDAKQALSQGAYRGKDGQLVDEATVRRARATLERWNSRGGSPRSS